MNRLFLLSLPISLIAIFSLAIVDATSKDKDDDGDDEEKREKKIGEVLDLAGEFSISDKIEFCHYMKKSGWFKEELKDSISCLDYAQDPTKEKDIKNFVILRGYGLFSGEDQEDE